MLSFVMGVVGSAMVGPLADRLGRFGMVFSPGMVGILSAWLDSVGGAVSLASLAPLLCILLVLFLVPETRGRVLEEIVPDAGGVQPPAIGDPQDP